MRGRGRNIFRGREDKVMRGDWKLRRCGYRGEMMAGWVFRVADGQGLS